MAILGTMALLVFDLLYGLLREVGEAPSELTFESLISQAREKALIEGKILTLHIDFEEREFGLRFYDPRLESSVDPSLAQLTKKGNYLQQSNEEKEPQKVTYLVEKKKLPPNLIKIHSITGLTLAGPDIYLHFYPDGTSDSFILEFDREENRYLYVPRMNTSPRYLQDLKAEQDEFP